MPIYEYVCKNCQHELEVLQKISEPHLTECPECGNPTLKRKTSISAFHLKGGGWYKDGYNIPNNNTADKPESSTDKPESSTDKPESSVSKPAADTSTGDKKTNPKPDAAAVKAEPKTSSTGNMPSTKAS